MQTPWGDIAVSDAHVHFFSHRFFSLLGAQRGCSAAVVGALLDWEVPAPEPEKLSGIWVQELDRMGVQRAALIASIPGDEESVAAAVQAHPQRFYGFFMVDPTAPDAGARVGNAVQGGLLQGICLFPAMHRYSLHDPRVLALIETAASRPGSLVFVHCGVLTVGARRKLGLSSQFDLRFSNPVDVHALALRFPELAFVIPHFGSGLFREALMVADLCPNVYLDTSSSNSWVKYQEPGCTLISVFRRALQVCGPQRLLFGTDSSCFPRGWHRAVFDQQVQTLAEIGLSPADAQAILGENLQRILARA